MILTLKLQIFRYSFHCLRYLFEAPKRTDFMAAKNTKYRPF